MRCRTRSGSGWIGLWRACRAARGSWSSAARGIDAGPLNAITDEPPGGLDVLPSNSVLLHFTRSSSSTWRRRPAGHVAASLSIT
jgi:hypothetical protein